MFLLDRFAPFPPSHFRTFRTSIFILSLFSFSFAPCHFPFFFLFLLCLLFLRIFSLRRRQVTHTVRHRRRTSPLSRRNPNELTKNRERQRCVINKMSSQPPLRCFPAPSPVKEALRRSSVPDLQYGAPAPYPGPATSKAQMICRPSHCPGPTIVKAEGEKVEELRKNSRRVIAQKHP